HILTSNHVVAKTDKIEVTLSDSRTLKAEIVGRDSMTDLALIQIETEDQIKPLSLGDSQELKVGDWVVAIGNPFGLGNTVTAGIVSATYRQLGAYDEFIQTDAPINPGNSGGPLLNTKGEAVGINTAIFSQSGGNIGIGFAIPINTARELIPELREGNVIRGWLGVVIQPVTPQAKAKLGLEKDHGALVLGVRENSPAAEAGIKPGDVITAYDGKQIKESTRLPRLVMETPVGEEVAVKIRRQGEEKTLQVEIGKRNP
ncbi:MAG: S1C family serine protease, partial [Syntrophobacteria bacterium]